MQIDLTFYEEYAKRNTRSYTQNHQKEIVVMGFYIGAHDYNGRNYASGTFIYVLNEAWKETLRDCGEGEVSSLDHIKNAFMVRLKANLKQMAPESPTCGLMLSLLQESRFSWPLTKRHAKGHKRKVWVPVGPSGFLKATEKAQVNVPQRLRYGLTKKMY